MAPNNAIKKPIAAALPIALLIEQPKNLSIGTFITAPPIPIIAEIKPTIKPSTTFKYNFISDKENYYIIRKKYSIDYINNILNTKFRGFNTFKLDSNCELIYTTKSKSNNKIAES